MFMPNQLTMVVREPAGEEIHRLALLFRHEPLTPEARILAAVKSRPVERFVAAVAWWIEGMVGFFKLGALPGLATRTEICGQLIREVANGCRQLGLSSLQYGDLLPDDSEWSQTLKQSGLECLRSERFFEAPAQQARRRIVESFKKYESLIPPGWRTEAIRQHSPDTVSELIAPYRLMPPEELRARWRADCPDGFHLDFSSILFDGASACGVLLLRRSREGYCIDVRVVKTANRQLRSLGNLLLLYHGVHTHGPFYDAEALCFRGGEAEHRETANLAIRMGGRELPCRRVWGKVF